MKYIVGMDIGCLLLNSVIMFVYFGRKKIKNLETKFYSVLLLITFFGYIIEAFMFLSNILSWGNRKIIVSTYLSYLILTGILFILYNTIKLLNFKYGSENKTVNKKLYILFAILCPIFLTLSIITYLYPGDVVYHGEWAYGTGIAITFITVVWSIALIYLTYIFIKYRKKMTAKDKMFYTPVVCLSIVVPLTRIFAPHIAVTNIYLSMLTLMMFFTIENPDVDVINKMDRLNNVKSNFLSSMSHELKTPLNAIVGLSGCPSDNYETLKEDMKTINQESLLLLDMFTNIININLVDAKDIVLNNREYNVASEFKNIVNSFEKRFESKGLVLDFNISENMPITLIGDFEKIKDITCNFLSNALKFTDHGTCELNISYENKLNISYLKVEVKDTGKGISDEDFKILFSEFGKGKNEINSNISGLGLGLSLCKILADALDGKISLGSVPGMGSSFVVEIPQETKKA